MTLTEALKCLQNGPKQAPPFAVTLACGFTPLHVQTFLGANLQRSFAQLRVTITPGLFGDLAGTVESLVRMNLDAAAVVIEWSDLDSRLGYRELGAWGPAAVPDIVTSARATLERIAAALERVTIPVAVSTPTLPLPPLFHTAGWHASEEQILLEGAVADFTRGIARLASVRLVSSAFLDQESPRAARFDLKSDLNAAMPYSIAHADILAAALARLIAPAAPKKGLITDLDDTLWRGILGEVGVNGVSWDVASHHQLHGLYQKLLASLSEEGALVAIASKNDPVLVTQALQREDLLVKPKHVFPVEANWQPKSASVTRILETWNIGADSVVFLDDSAMELAEVAAAHPGIECLRFPTGDDREAEAMLRRLRDLFGKPRISQEDRVRLESIRAGAEFRENSGAASADAEKFLSSAEAEITFDFSAGSDPRALELVNKTNQFNLNGRRRSDAEWARNVASENTFTAVISYSDRFGPLGKTAVVQGVLENRRIHIHTWVMSCRAFSRRIEHATLRQLFTRFDATEAELDFEPTPRNGPIQEFLSAMLGSAPEQGAVLARSEFDAACPRLYQQVKDRAETEMAVYG